ncbi:putative P-loop containing nucleoside triphosphate hydrolase, leucine-rich repeat domain, L [Medicago truncatula]|uniref:Putative P-loop containing nucleoside triphosphate hydrolase, leucine-rich repeat domain, L n=1 Tax=Medicago truncatula TaxID=3880 RepID=A0A396HJH2_MEDTR|nr:putative disease resistance protein RGA1 [Medicago truncatula]RHN51994.1 putative P-loop containing nucleoside triphosphate hydrolase, leucine-rich repeat domain, L [Medicago truncatula]
MAEQIPYAVAASLINRLASAAFHEFGRIHGVMHELERLKNTVESVRAVLLDAEEKQQQSHGVQNWIRRLKDDVLHPADDLLDEFSIEDMRHKRDEARKNKVTQVLHRLSPNRIAFSRKMAHEIEKIQTKFNDVVKDMSGLNLNSNVVVVEQSDIVRRETSSFVSESDIIGREDDRNKIISLLRQSHENQNVSLVAIVGIGGLGKTALAQLVYNDGEVTKSFEKRMWVCVSNNFDVKTILKNMLKSLNIKNEEIDNLSFDNLQKMLRDNLTGKRYLLLLDDVWNESLEKWDQLKTYLMCGAQGSKVVVTTRSKIVAQTMGVSVPYTLNGLTPEKSWCLLKNITYRDETKGVLNQNLEAIGKKIAEKCSGVPLAIRTLGGLLQGKSEETEWVGVLQDDFWKLCEDEETIMPVLKLSYQNLSPQLRQCFSYCSLYPKDWEIKKDELIQLWMAQGYLECSTQKQGPEDIGNQFVKIFLMKSFFQDAKIDDCGDICSFKMHDLMHDLAMQIAGNDCCYIGSETKRLAGSPIHVMLKLDFIGWLESLDASRLRTLILLHSDLPYRGCEKLSVILKFNRLRVLMVKPLCKIKLRDFIVKLKHLRYLNFSQRKSHGSDKKAFTNAVYLQTLILTLCDERFSQKNVSNLINLRHLKIEVLPPPPPWPKEAKSSRFAELCVGKVLPIFRELRVGKVHKCAIFSKGYSLLSNIVEISLTDYNGLPYLPPMERLPFLKSLKIRYLPKLEYILYEEPLLCGSFFPSLEKLIIEDCLELRGWRRMGDDINDDDNTSQSHHLSFPPFSSRLSLIEITYCRILTCMPTFPNLDKKLELVSSCVEP